MYCITIAERSFYFDIPLSVAQYFVWLKRQRLPADHTISACSVCGRESRCKIGVRRVGGRPESASIGIGLAIHDTKRIITLSILTKEQQTS